MTNEMPLHFMLRVFTHLLTSTTVHSNFVGTLRGQLNMAKQISRLNALKVQATSKPGKHADGNGLYLQVSKQGTKSWIFRYMLHGKPREMGLGPTTVINLTEARAKAIDCKKLLLDGVDPIGQRNQTKKQKLIDQLRTITFDECAKAYISAHQHVWKNQKHISQWENTIATHASPVIGGLPVTAIDTTLVMKVIEPIWQSTPETASRLRNRIELVISWATARGYRVGENPARWKGHLDQLLPSRSRVQKVKHHSALPILEMPKFMKMLRKEKHISAYALEFLILTATRTSEVLNATWDEVDIEKAIWIIPASRMKASREHRIPLSPRAIELLSKLKEVQSSNYIFGSYRKGKPMSNMALLVYIKRKGFSITVHGFRSTFRDWASEYTNVTREVAEAALAHTLKNKVEAAYRRGDLFLKRKVLMNDWARFCYSEITDQRVVSLKGRQA